MAFQGQLLEPPTGAFREMGDLLSEVYHGVSLFVSLRGPVVDSGTVDEFVRESALRTCWKVQHLHRWPSEDVSNSRTHDFMVEINKSGCS